MNAVRAHLRSVKSHTGSKRSIFPSADKPTIKVLVSFHQSESRFFMARDQVWHTPNFGLSFKNWFDSFWSIFVARIQIPNLV